MDVTYIDGGYVKRFSGTMSDNLLSKIISAYAGLDLLISELSGGAVESTHEIVVVPKPLKKISPLPYGYWPSPEDVMEDLKYYAPPGTYDSVFVVWYNGPINLNYFGLGGVFINNKTTIYSVIASHEEWVWTYGGRPGEVFLHEMLHGVEIFFSELGYPMPEGGLHGGEIHGYVWSYENGWTEWYRDFMQGRVWEPKLGRYTGIPKEAWSEHCSPRVKMIRDFHKEISKIMSEYNSLNQEYNSLRNNYNSLNQEYNSLNQEYNSLNQEYNSL
ncbi:MAG: hypothetical protein N3D78_01820, partial [Candidatus Aenigmarchaeota archaeon]|nr:hypothetical protein [Candidatus Aenigmarchaeota archaeon]